MCQKLGLDTIGEGIETQRQLDVLRDLGCTEVQGYLLGRPLPRDKVDGFIQNHAASQAADIPQV
jgi:EAL domain-containing protein (putative c-di-GMP-specific phosphodiesterase class I)